MSIDTQSLRSTIRRLEHEIAALRRLADDAEAQAAHATATGAADSTHAQATSAQAAAFSLEGALSPEVQLPRPAVVQAYVRTRPALAHIAADMAPAILQEFSGEPCQVILDVYDDPEIDDHYLVYYVRLPDYDDGFMDRLERITAMFAEQFRGADQSIALTTDFRNPS